MGDMEVERWYPTVASDGGPARMFVLGGTDFDGMATMPVVNTYESFLVTPGSGTPASNYEQKVGAQPIGQTNRQYSGTSITVPIFGTGPAFTEYPRVHALGILDPNGNGTAPRMFLSGYWGQGFHWAHNPLTNPIYGHPAYGQSIGTTVPSYVQYSTNILMPTSIGAVATLVVRIGGNRGVLPAAVGPTNLVESVNAGAAPSVQGTPWSSGGPTDIPDMAHERFFGNVSILPTGDLFAVGGNDPAGPALEPEIFSAAIGNWKPKAVHVSPRDYHSCSIPLPDGSVLVCGGEGRTDDYEIYEPEYLQAPIGRRPVGVSLAAVSNGAAISQTQLQGVAYNAEYDVRWTNLLPTGVNVTEVVLLAPASLTHHDDGGQRHVRLLTWIDNTGDATGGAGVGSVRIRMPATVRHAPPGWYMLFVITSEGIPANAFWVNLG